MLIIKQSTKRIPDASGLFIPPTTFSESMLLHRIHVKGHFNDSLIELVTIDDKTFEDDSRFVEFRYRTDTAANHQPNQMDVECACQRVDE